MTSLTDFLLARIAEDEGVAREIDAAAWDYDIAANRETWADGDRVSVGVGRVLAECEAKRRIVEWHSAMENDLHDGSLDRRHALLCSECTDVDPYSNQVAYPCRTLLTIASVYADHPDFNPAWQVAD